MNLIRQTLIIAYMFLGLPFLLGILWSAVFRKNKKYVSEILTDGYLLMLAFFLIVSVPAIKMQWVLSKLAGIWAVFVIVVSLAVLLLCRKKVQTFWAEMRVFWKHNAKMKKIAGIFVLGIVIAVMFTRPNYEDATLEIVEIAVVSDGMYTNDPYSGQPSDTALSGHAYAPIEMLYAVSACLTGIDVSLMLHYLIPICILVYFYMGIWRVGKELFDTNKDVSLFTLIAVGLYWMTTYLEGQSVVTGIFLNSWNGLTMLSCMIMPVAFSVSMSCLKEAKEGGNRMGIAEKIFLAVVLLLAGQLTNEKGGFYIALMLLVTVAVIIVRKGYDYVIKTGCFKKRI